MGTSKKISREGIVVRLTRIKESDAMVNALGPEGIFSFYARGIGKLTSKNGGAVQSLSHSSFFLVESTTGAYTLSEAKPIASYLPTDSKLEQFATLSFVEELTAKMLDKEEGGDLYTWLLKTLESIKDGFEPLTAGLIYFAKFLMSFGIGLDVDECVICHKKNDIIAISYDEGGFLCREDSLARGVGQQTPMKLNILRYLFRMPIEKFTSISFDKEETIPLYRELGEYLYERTGLKLKSLPLFEKL